MIMSFSQKLAGTVGTGSRSGRQGFVFLTALLMSIGLSQSPTHAGVTALGSVVSQYGNSTTMSYTVSAGTDRVLVVTVSDPDSTNVSAVTFAGLPLTEGNAATDNAVACDEIWYRAMDDDTLPTTGNIVVTRGGSIEVFIGAAVYSGVDQSTPITAGPVAGNPSGSNVGSSVNVSSKAGDVVLDVFDAYLQGHVPASTAGSGQSILLSQSGSITSQGFVRYASSTEPGAASVTMSWTSEAEAMLHVTVNINQAPPTYNISGLIRTNALEPIPGVNVLRTGSQTPAVTNSSGFYQFTGVPAGLYTLTPSLSGATFSPTSQGLRVSTADRAANFVGTPPGSSVSGRVFDANGTGIGGVTVTRTGGATATTNSAGYYTLYYVPGGNTTLTPTKAGMTFTPPSLNLTVAGNSSGNNFIGKTGVKITGRLATSGGVAIVGATVACTGGVASVVSNSAGYYTLINVPDGSQTITPTLGGTTFTPDNRTVTVAGEDIAGQNFTGS